MRSGAAAASDGGSHATPGRTRNPHTCTAPDMHGVSGRLPGLSWRSPGDLSAVRDKFGIRVEGTHEVDKTWMKQLRAKPVKLAPAIVPRIVFEVRDSSPSSRPSRVSGGHGR